MPVDQTGEIILFVMGENSTEAHIQIQYDPDAEADEFAWVIPITELPEFAVGSDLLFDNILSGTVPQYGFTRQADSCGDGGSGDDGGGDATGAAGDETGDSGGPEIVFSDTVGAFSIVVLQGGTSQEVIDWLDLNGYQQDPEAEPIFEEYLAEGYLFAAIKLTNGADTSEIHPISLTFPNNEACVPIRLTRIAAVDDMEIRSFFLADNRVVPDTYKHVLINPLKLDWPNLASNYKEVISLAVDADEANGKAFVTEYAGPSDIVSKAGLYSASWDSAPFATANPVDVVDLLQAQQLMSCFDVGGGSGGSGGDPSACAYEHPLLRGLLAQWLPVPVGVEELDFYGCLSCYEGLIDAAAWDGDAFALAMDERIIAPGLHADQLLDTWPYLTRMYTTISPAEMTADPFFHVNPDLDDVDLTNQIATWRSLCNGDSVWTLPNGDEVYTPGAWPSFDDEMPWEEEVSEIASRGAPIVLVDQTAAIDAALEEHNCNYDWPSPEACGNGGLDDGADTGGSDDDAGSTGDSATGGVDTDDGPSAADGGNGDGCGCRSGSGHGGLMFALLGLGLGLGATRRRRD